MRGFPVNVQKLCRNSDSYYRTVLQKYYSSYCNSIAAKPGDVTGSVGQSHSSEEVSVMGMERRALIIQSNYFNNSGYSEDDERRDDKIITGK